jgi:hypothetical protein
LIATFLTRVMRHAASMVPRRNGGKLRRALPLSGFALLAACGIGDPSGLGPWQEEVQLSDGRVILVERVEDSTVRKPIGDAGGAFLNETTLKVVAPAELAAALPMLTTRFRPLILDFDPTIGTWFVIAFDERVCMDRIRKRVKGEMDATGLINLRPNFEYQLQQGRWVEVPVVPERIGLPVNLLVQRTTVDERMRQREPVRLKEKRQLDSHPRLPHEYRRVVPRVGCG